MYKKYCDLRDKHGLKDAGVAKLLNITPSTFTDWKKGKSSPNTDKLKALSHLFNVSLEYLLSDDTPEDILNMLSLMGYEVWGDDGVTYYADSFNHDGNFDWDARDQSDMVTICRRNINDADVFDYEKNITIKEFKQLMGKDFDDLRNWLNDYQTEAPALSDWEKELINIYRQLKDKQELRDYAHYLLSKEKRDVTDSKIG
jgi:repressor LexA